MFSLVQIGMVVWASLLSPAPDVCPPPAFAVAEADADVSVRIFDGRTYTASIDRRTSADRLWLRIGRGRIELLRPIKWDRVESVKIAGSEVSGLELREYVRQLQEEAISQ